MLPILSWCTSRSWSGYLNFVGLINDPDLLKLGKREVFISPISPKEPIYQHSLWSEAAGYFTACWSSTRKLRAASRFSTKCRIQTLREVIYSHCKPNWSEHHQQWCMLSIFWKKTPRMSFRLNSWNQLAKLSFTPVFHSHLVCLRISDCLSKHPSICSFPFFPLQTEQLVTLWILFIVTIAGNATVLFSTWRRKRKSRMTYFVTQLAITGTAWEGKGCPTCTGIIIKMTNKKMWVEWWRIQLPPNVQLQFAIKQMDGCLS